MFKVGEDNEGANAVGSFFDGLAMHATIEPPETESSSNAPLELMRAYILADLTAKDVLCTLGALFVGKEDLINWINNLPAIQDSSDLGVVTYYVRLNFSDFIYNVSESLKKEAINLGLSSSLFQYKKLRLDGAGRSTKLSPALKRLAKSQPYTPVSEKIAKKIGRSKADILDASVSDSVTYLGYDSLDDLLDALHAGKAAGKPQVLDSFLDSHAPDQVVTAICGLIFLAVLRGLDGLSYAANGIKYKADMGPVPDSVHTEGFRYHFEQDSITRGDVCQAINNACYMLGFAFWLVVSLLSTRAILVLFGRPACEEILAVLRDHMSNAISLAASITQTRVDAILFLSGSEALGGDGEDEDDDEDEDEDEDARGGSENIENNTTSLRDWLVGSWDEEDEEKEEDEEEDGDDKA